MGRADDPSSLTPTELNEGAAPGGPTAYDRFRSLYGTAKDDSNDAVSKFEAWKSANPIADWAASAPAPLPVGGAAGLVRGAYAAGGAMGAPEPQTIGIRQPESFERERPAPPGYDGGEPMPTAKASALPNAPMKAPAMGPGMGPGGDIYEGYGTDKGVLHSQQDTLADMSGFQEKKGEEYSAHLASLKSAADMEREVAAQQRTGAKAYQAAVAEEDQRQQGQEQKVQQATDSAAAAGIDPGRFFKNRDTGFWINMMIGSIAGGYLSATPGMNGKNAFMDSVRDMQDKDIKAQESAIDQGWKKVKGTETAYERMRLNGVDKTTATLKQADLTLQALQTDIKGRLMTSQIPEEKARLEGALQTLQIERDKYATTIQESWRATRESRGRAAAMAALAAHAAERQGRLDADEHILKMSQAEKNSAEAGKMKTEGGDKKLTAAAQAYDVHKNYLDNIQKQIVGVPGDITHKFGAQNLPWGTQARQYGVDLDKYNSEVDTIIGHWAKDEEGKIPVEEFKRLVTRYEIPTDHNMTDPEKAARIKGLAAYVDQRAKTAGVGRAGQVTPGAPTGLGDIPSFRPPKAP